MGPIGEQELDRLDSPFHKNLVGNVDGLIRHMEGMLSLLEDREGGEGEEGKKDHASNTTTTTTSMMTTAMTTDANLLWNKTTETFNTVLGGLQTFVTGLRFQYSSLDREAEELEALKKSLEGEQDVMTEQSHELHCRIQYNALEMKLDQSFRDTERCSSVESARCFKEEAQENLRRTQEIIRTANLRNCQLDMDIFNEMEHITTAFHEYRKERDTYVAELDLFDDVRRRKISDWMKDPSRNGAERDLGENIIEYLELTSCRRHLEPKIIANTLRMQSMNESLAFDRQDNLKRLEEMTGLQKRIEDLTGLNNVMPRTTPASTDLAKTVQGQLSNVSDFKSSDFLDQHEQEVEECHASSGHGLHRCPRKINLATDPITDPELRQELESALRWENNDGVPLPVSTSTEAADVDATAAVGEETSNSDPETVTGSREPVTDGGTCTTTSEDLQDPASVICSSRRLVENQPEKNQRINGVEEGNNNDEVRGREGSGSATSLCGDALLPTRKKLALAPSDTDNKEMTGNHHPINRSHSPNNPRVTVTGAAIINNVAVSGGAAANTAVTAEVSMPRSSHLLLHHVESATGTTGSSCQGNLMFGLVKKKSGGGPSSMTAIVDSEKDAGGGCGSGRMTSQANRMAAADDRETRSQGWTPSGGRAGCSGTNANSGNPRN